MTTLRRRMLEDVPLRGRAPNTQPCDVAAVHHLAPDDRRPPDQLSEAERRQDCRDWLQAQQVAASTCRLHLDGIRGCSELTRKRPWPVCDLVRPRHLHNLPVVCSPREGRERLALVKHPTARMCLRLIDACGLRLREGTPRQLADSASPRLLVLGRPGQGGQDRDGPRADRTRPR
jgi:hypothetical protein